MTETLLEPQAFSLYYLKQVDNETQEDVETKIRGKEVIRSQRKDRTKAILTWVMGHPSMGIISYPNKVVCLARKFHIQNC